MKQKRASKFLKIVDGYLGRLLLLVISLLKKLDFFNSRELKKNPESIAVFCIAAIGDLILLSEPIKVLKAKYPEIKISLFCGPDNQSVLSLVDPRGEIFAEVIKIEPKNVFKSLAVLFTKSFDVVIDSGQWARISAIYAWATKSKWLIGFSTEGQHRGFIFDQKIEHSKKCHELENYRRLFSNWITSEEVKAPKISLSARTMPPKSIVFHPFAAGERNWQKEWEPQNWNLLGKNLLQQGYSIYITGGPADETKVIDIFTEDILSKCHNMVGKLTLAETGQLLAGAQCVVSVNTGIMHLAAAVGVKLIALHGPTNPLRWGPVSKNAFVIAAKIPCAPCLNLGSDYGCLKNTCMRSLLTSQVEEIILRS